MRTGLKNPRTDLLPVAFGNECENILENLVEMVYYNLNILLNSKYIKSGRLFLFCSFSVMFDGREKHRN